MDEDLAPPPADIMTVNPATGAVCVRILRNGQIGLIFVAPHQRETLRIKGLATIHNDPETLEAMQVGGKPALVYTRVRPTECHFHCGKALIRSNLWQPEKWTGDAKSIAARGYARQKLLGTDDEFDTIQGLLDAINAREKK
jgi:predicted pyridoxine 5'-phosphate oxidase superfamily flavin-nucleotide-binding protein